MEKINFFAAYFYISGLYCLARAVYINNWGKQEKREEIKEKIDELQALVSFNVLYLLYLLCILFGWIIFPISLVSKIIKIFTGKDIFD